MATKLTPLIPRDEADGKAVRLNVTVPPRLDRSLDDYMRFYAEGYGEESPAKTRLMVLMAQKLLDDDKDFQKWSRQQAGATAAGN